MIRVSKAHFRPLWALLVLASLATARSAEPKNGPALTQAVRKEFGTARGDYILPHRLVSQQIFMGMGIPLPTVRLDDGNYLISGCRVHSCDEKAAAIVTPAESVVAAGVIHYSITPWTGSPILTMFVKQKNNRPVVLEELRKWAEDALAEDRKEYSKAPYLGKVETRVIP